MLQQIIVLVCEIDPDLNPVEGLVVFGRNEAKPIDMLAVVEVLSQEIKHQVGIDFILVLLSPIHRKHEPPALLVLRVLPLRLNPLLEILH